MSAEPKTDVRDDRIIVAKEVATENTVELSELEYGLEVCGRAFHRWVQRCAHAAGLTDLAPLDVMVLKHVNHKGRAKSVGDVAFILNADDTHTITYSLKKLQKRGFLESTRHGKETLYKTTKIGEAGCARYARVRQACLVDGLQVFGMMDREELHQAANILRVLSGLYDQAARSATSF